MFKLTTLCILFFTTPFTTLLANYPPVINAPIAAILGNSQWNKFEPMDYLALLEGEWEGNVIISTEDGKILSNISIVQTYQWVGNTLECTSVFDEQGKTHISKESITADKSKLVKKIYTKESIVYYTGKIEGQTVVWNSDNANIRRSTTDRIRLHQKVMTLEIDGYQMAEMQGKEIRLKLNTSLRKN